MARKKPQNTWILIAGGAAVIVLLVLLVTLDAPGSFLSALVRGGALIGYVAVFLANLSSLYVRELARYFGRPFIKVHHWVSFVGLAALILHAGGVFWNAGNLAVFLPEFSSLRAFFALGGRPALWLIAVAVLAAALRKTLGRRWKVLHGLNYLAFILGTVHGIMIGADFEHFIVRIISVAMTLALVGAFFVKLRRTRQRAKRRS